MTKPEVPIVSIGYTDGIHVQNATLPHKKMVGNGVELLTVPPPTCSVHG